jgi:hypothetical protein
MRFARDQKQETFPLTAAGHRFCSSFPVRIKVQRSGCLGFRLITPALCLSLLLFGCHRIPPVAVGPPPSPTPPPTGLEAAENQFYAGEYASATQAYEAYLAENAEVPQRDQALFHLALCYALAGKDEENFTKAQSLLRTLFTQFAHSQYRPEAEYILSLQADIDRMRVDIRERDDRIREQDDALPQIDKTLKEKGQTLREKEIALRQKDRILRQKDKALREKDKVIQDQEDRILKLTRELERMKKIDMRTPPSHPRD